MTTPDNNSTKRIIKSNSIAGLHIRVWIILSIIFLAISMLPALLSPLDLIVRIIVIIVGLIPLIFIAIYAARRFDKSMTLEENQLTIYEFGRTVVIPFDQIEELMYTDLHLIGDPFANSFPVFFKVVTKNDAISYVAAAGTYNVSELKAFYDAFPDSLKTHIDKDRAIIQARMNRQRVGKSGFLDQTTTRSAKVSLLRYGVMIVVLILIVFLAKSLL